MQELFKTIEIIDGTISVLDQTKLPREEVYLEARTTEDVWDYIKRLVVRGATLIGVTAGYGMWLAAKEILQGIPEGQPLSEEELDVIGMALREKADYLNSSRPTAVNLSYAIKRMLARYDDVADSLVSQDPKKARYVVTAEDIIDEMFDEAETLKQEEVDTTRAKGEHSFELIHDGMTVLTHCNAGGLASVGGGGIFEVFYLGKERGMNFKLYCDETRPLLQGARLSAWELNKMGIDTTLICDNMAATVLKKGLIDAVLVGCDRMAANGDAANKIGTSGLAVLAKEYGVPVYFSLPISTIDLDTATGDDIVIEQRDGEEIASMWYKERMAPEGIKLYNPAFDVTDHELITAVITEKGVIYPPYDVNIPEIMKK